MNKRRTFSGIYALAVLILGVWLDEHGMKLASQIVVITALALLTPVGIAVVGKGFRRTSFWVALGCCVLFHALLLWHFLPSLPFSTLGVEILFGIPECFCFSLVSAKIVELYP